MASIGKKPEHGTTAEFEDFRRKLDECLDGIRKVRGGKTNDSEITLEQRAELRGKYACAAQLAKSIADLPEMMTTDLGQQYDKMFRQLSDKAAEYGSAMKNVIPDTTYDDIKGLESVKKLVRSFEYMIAHPEVVKHYKLAGGLGMMLYGAPGTGKTMFAEAIANSLRLPLFVVTPADIFKSYVGASEEAVRQLFREMDACSDGAILFVDECESIFSRRDQDTKDYKAAVTTELLQRLNGFGVDGSKRIIIAATNRPDVIDPAYLRYKRFSHLVHIPPPDAEAMRQIIAGKLDGIELDGVNVEDVLFMAEMRSQNAERGVAYYSAADLCGIVEEACRLALEKLQAAGSSAFIPLTRDMFEQAFERVPPSIPEELLRKYENFRAGD